MYKVLVAEDELIERKVLCKTIQKYLSEMCTVIEAKNGREALELFEREGPHVAILDIQMPGLTGLEVAARIRDSGRPCAVLFLSAYDHFAYARQAICVHAVDYILKPYDQKELVASLEEAFRVYEWFQSTAPRTPKKAEPSEQTQTGESDSSRRISQVRDEIEGYISAHFADDLSMQDVARAMNYSDAYFCKLFKQCFKVNFSTYLNEYRVEKAKNLLQTTRSSIKDISIRCGYTDSNYFARVFRRVTGVTPSEYRQTRSKLE